jgi:hypothetical protein
MKTPSNWELAGACTAQSKAPCSSQAADTDVDVWRDPANQGRRVTVITCRGGGCAAKQPNGAPTFPPKVIGAASTQVRSSGRLAYTLGAGNHAEGPYRIDGLFVTTAAGRALSFPVYTVTTSLPDSVHWLADQILTSFTIGPPPSG